MKPKPTRREFHKAMVLAAAAPLALAGTSAAAQEEPPKNARAAVADALTQILRTRYGKHLSEEQFKRLRQKVLNGLSAAEQMQRLTLLNGDEPAFVFSAQHEA